MRRYRTDGAIFSLLTAIEGVSRLADVPSSASLIDGHLLTLRQVLDLDVMEDTTVLAGAAGLDRRIRGINIIEVPDVWKWLEGGELLLSAGYVWRDHPELMLDLVSRLEKARVSGIAFKCGRYLPSVPRALLAQANEVGLPVLRLPSDMAYRQVLESLYGSLASRALLFDVSRRARQAFTHFSLDEQSIEKIVGSLARQLGRQALVVDLLDEKVINASEDGVTRYVGLDELDERTDEMVRMLEMATLHRSPSQVRWGQSHGMGSALVVGHRTQGYILVHGSAPFDEGDAGTFGHAGELVSFLLLKRMALLEGRRQAGGLYLRSLMSDTLTNEEAAERGLTLGLRLTQPCAVFVLSFPDSPGLPAAALEAVMMAIDRALARTPHVLAAGAPPDAILGLVQVATDEDTLDHILNVVVTVAGREGSSEPMIACGSPATGVDGVRRSRSEALIAHETAGRLRRRGLTFFDDLGVERLLSQIPAGELATSYVTTLLGPLDDDPDLLRTVELYLQHGCNKVATAAAVPLHRSSLIYRLQKAERLLDIDLDSPERCLEIWVAIRLRRMFEVSGS